MFFPAPPRRRLPTTLWLKTLLVAVSLVTVTAATVRAQDAAPAEEDDNVATAKVVTKATPRFIETLLDKLEYDYKPSGKNGYLVKLEGENLNGVKMAVLIESGGGIMLYCGFHGVKVDTKKMNEWNKKHRFSRAYIDDSNDPVLESDLDFDGGVTLDSLKIFVRVFKSSISDYKKFLVP